MKCVDASALLRVLFSEAKGSFAVNVRALDAIHVATAEILAAAGERARERGP